MNAIVEWWDGLELAARIFWTLGILGTAMLVAQGGMALFGADGDFDSPDADGDAGVHWFSFKAITAFATGSGWGGLCCLQLGLGAVSATLLAALVGFALAALLVWLMRQFARLAEDGTFQLTQTVGASGTVYLPLPPRGAGAGEITVVSGGRKVSVKAFNVSDRAAPFGTEVRVLRLEGTGVAVEPLADGE
ncbi:MAG: hypothetical protein LBK71_03760 [Verrucomicrobiales bacterium]|jgi:hypothetical protein|nr:hypothetical protein [Verrucomicrobiales bacterium]